MTDDGNPAVENPYAAPQFRETVWPSRQTLIRRIPFVLLVGLGAYAVFTALLLNSVADDVTAGILMAVHLALLIAGTVFSFHGGYSFLWVGVAGIVGQVCVCGIMLIAGIGEPRVVIEINGWIVLGFALIAAFYIVAQWRRRLFV